MTPPTEKSPGKGPLGFRFSTVSELLAITAVLLPAIGVAVLWLRYFLAGYSHASTLATLPGLGELALVGLGSSWHLIAFVPLFLTAWFAARARYRGGQIASKLTKDLDPDIQEAEELRDSLADDLAAIGSRFEEYRVDDSDGEPRFADVPDDVAKEIVAEYQDLKRQWDLLVEKVSAVSAAHEAAVQTVLASLSEELPKWFRPNIEWSPDKGKSGTVSLGKISFSFLYLALLLFSPFPSGTVIAAGLAGATYLGIRLATRAGERDKAPTVGLFSPLIALIATVGILTGGLQRPPGDVVVDVNLTEAGEVGQETDRFVLAGVANGYTYLGRCDGVAEVMLLPSNQVEMLRFAESTWAADVAWDELTWENLLRLSLFNVVFNVVPVDDTFITYSEACIVSPPNG